jgi:hypothetical protein
MVEQLKLIQEINKSCKVFFLESTFFLHLSKVNRFELKGDNVSKALNNLKNYGQEISVLKWFDDYWVFIEIRFEDNNSFITISIFQGDANDNIKNQLFRAEWDDFNNPDEKHPQPHWHITSNQAMEKSFQNFLDEEEEVGFVADLYKEQKSKIIDVNKIHFPMNGNWINDDGHIHLINDNEKMVKWFQGFFSTIRVQLEYVK